MSQVEFYDPVKRLHGKLNKSEPIIMRQKKFKAPNGAVLKEGVQESYTLHNPREFIRERMKNSADNMAE